MPQSSSLLVSEDASPGAGRFNPFTCEWSDTSSGIPRVRVTGELDLATAPRLEHALRDAQSHAMEVVLDLRNLEFMDCAGMRTVIEAHERGEREGGRLTVVRGRAEVDRLFTLTGTRERLTIVDLDPAEPAVQALLKRGGDRGAA